MQPNRRSLVGAIAIVTVLLALGQGPVFARSATSPDKRASFDLAPDANGNIILFGGDQLYPDGNVSTWFEDTWTWDGAAWTERHTATSPGPRCCYAMAYDSVRRQTVLFGGYDGTTLLNDTWTWDGETWTRQFPATVPPAQYGPGMAFDARKGEMVLLSGAYYPGNNPAGAISKILTWTWDGSDWTQQPPLKLPRYRERMGMAYDGARGEVDVFGGEYPSFEWTDYLNDTLSWVWTKWAWHNPRVRPSQRSMMGIAYDPNLQQIVLFGGDGGDSGTWLWDGHAWSHAHPVTAPRPRWAQAMAWDGVRRQIVMFGGREYRLGYVDLGDTWIWDGVDWTCVMGCAT
jgi:hypothetical protein